MSARYPAIGPYDHGLLDVGDGQRLYWEACGNPAGRPAVVLHGGPGSGCTPGLRRHFDPAAYRIVLGAPGRTPTSPPARASRPARATTTRRSGCASPGS